MIFNSEELLMMMLYNPGTRLGLIAELTTMKEQLTLREKRLNRLTGRLITKLENITDEDFEELDFYPDDED